jgi:hypothetical protein
MQGGVPRGASAVAMQFVEIFLNILLDRQVL